MGDNGLAFFNDIRSAVEVMEEMDAGDLSLWLRIMGAMVGGERVVVETDHPCIQWMKDYAPDALEMALPYLIWQQ